MVFAVRRRWRQRATANPRQIGDPAGQEKGMRHLLALLLVATLPAQNPYRVRDVNTAAQAPVDPGSGFRFLGTSPGANPVHWFSAATPDTGVELWRMQGNGQVLPVGDFAPGPEGSQPRLIDAGPPAVFAVNHPERARLGQELVRVGPTGQLEFLAEALLGPAGAYYSEPVAMGGASYVMRTLESGAAELVRVANGQATVITGLPLFAAFATLTVDESGLLRIFVKQEPLPDAQFVSDCTAAGTRRVNGTFDDVAVGRRGDLFGANTGDGNGTELHRFTATGTAPVRDINPAGNSSPRDFVLVAGITYFTADDGSTGRELWSSDGTGAGTRRVADLRPGAAGSDPAALTPFQGNLAFVANDGTRGRELHFLDVVTQVVRIVRDIRAGNLDSGIAALFGLGTALYFGADDGVTGRELWRSDGTTAGTTIVRDIAPGALGSAPRGFFELGGMLQFGADDGVRGFELWRSDGTANGTVLQQDLVPPVPSTEPSNPYGFHDAGWDVIFGATEAGTGTELYRLTFNGDDPAAGRIKNINPGGRNSDPREFVSLPDGRVLFTANHISFGREVWVTDGTDAGTVMVKDIRAGSTGAEPNGLLWVPGLRAVLFSADDGVAGREPWVSDGTSAGTTRLADILPGTAGSEAGFFTLRPDGTVFFRADDGQVGMEPWVLDPGSRAPRRLADLLNVGFGSFPRGFAFVDDGNGGTKTFFVADATLGLHALWVSDGTAAGTRLVRTFRHVQVSSGVVGFVDARVYFAADDGTSGIELWKSDGTTAGTAMVADIGPGSLGSIPEELTPMVESFQAATSRVFFRASTILGTELCVIGPHPVHGLRILDLNPWDGSSNPRSLSVEHGTLTRLVFSADGGDGTGQELWVSRGTQASTRRVADIDPRLDRGSNPDRIVATRDGWLLAADDGVHGREVWLYASLRGVALERGVGCGASPPTLHATPPRIGTTLRLYGSPGPGGSVGALMLNAPRSGATVPLLGCGYTFDPFSAVVVPLNSRAADWSLDLPLPAEPMLVDQQVDTRALSISFAPFEVQASAGLLLAIGL